MLLHRTVSLRQSGFYRWLRTATLSSLALASLTVAQAQGSAQCQNTANFAQWKADFEQYAISQGVDPAIAARVLDGVTLQTSVIQKDRAQGVFAQSFLEFSGRMVSQYRLDYGRNALRNQASLFDRIERQYGVPGPVLTAFWGLETDFGQVTGDSPVIPSIATLAYDCRRPELFRPQLLNAMYLVQNGDLAVNEMRGAWAGEMGQMQFLPKEYNEFAVDYDGDGRRNLIASTPDALASGANFLRSLGWRAGEPWLQEVRVPNDMDWASARLDNRMMPTVWASMGVQDVDGSSLDAPAIPAALVLPMGKNGPAFLAYPNFDIFIEWNQSLVYSLTAAYFATRLDGAPKVSSGNAPVTPLNTEQTKMLQRLLLNRGLPVGAVDGIIGNQTRDSVRAVQQELGLAADGYPTPALLDRLR